MSDPVSPQKMPYVMEMEPGDYWWCRCGRSQKQPFCDGSHAGTGLEPEKVTVPETKRLAWCGCKKSQTGAMCDGSHSKL